MVSAARLSSRPSRLVNTAVLEGQAFPGISDILARGRLYEPAVANNAEPRLDSKIERFGSMSAGFFRAMLR